MKMVGFTTEANIKIKFCRRGTRSNGKHTFLAMIADGKAAASDKCKTCKNFARYRGHLGPSGRKLQIEFENGLPGPLGPGPKKSKTESKKSRK